MNAWFLLLAVVLAAFSVLDAKRAMANAPLPTPPDIAKLGAPSDGDASADDEPAETPEPPDPETVKKRRLIASAVTGVGAIACVVLAFIS